MKMKKHLLVLLCLPVVVLAQTPRLTVEQATSGAAAVVTLAKKCQPLMAQRFKEAAWSRLRELLWYQSEEDYKISVDWAEMKLKAFAVSSANLSCEKAENMWFYAYHWGFRDFLQN